MAKLLRSAGLRRKRPAAVVSVGVAAEALAEMKATRAGLASLGNLLKTWLEFGDGVFKGKGQALKIARGPMISEVTTTNALLKTMEAAAATLNAQAARLGEPTHKEKSDEHHDPV